MKNYCQLCCCHHYDIERFIFY